MKKKHIIITLGIMILTLGCSCPRDKDGKFIVSEDVANVVTSDCLEQGMDCSDKLVIIKEETKDEIMVGLFDD